MRKTLTVSIAAVLVLAAAIVAMQLNTSVAQEMPPRAADRNEHCLTLQKSGAFQRAEACYREALRLARTRLP